MTILAVVYASAPAAEVIIPTLEIAHDAIETIRICAGFEDQELTLETEETVTFEAAGIEIALPKRDTSGQQTLTFAIDNVTGIAQERIDAALEAGGTVSITYREFLASDPSAPAGVPIRMTLVAGRFEGGVVQLQAAYHDLLTYGWPRERYTADFAPGLKYL